MAFTKDCSLIVLYFLKGFVSFTKHLLETSSVCVFLTKSTHLIGLVCSAEKYDQSLAACSSTGIFKVSSDTGYSYSSHMRLEHVLHHEQGPRSSTTGETNSALLNSSAHNPTRVVGTWHHRRKAISFTGRQDWEVMGRQGRELAGMQQDLKGRFTRIQMKQAGQEQIGSKKVLKESAEESYRYRYRYIHTHTHTNTVAIALPSNLQNLKGRVKTE